MSDGNWVPRDEQYLRGYASAMKYAATFVRDAVAQAPMLGGALEILAGHFDERIEMETTGARLDRDLENAIAAIQPSSIRSSHE